MDDMERNFRQADFSRIDKSLEDRIWQRIANRIETSNGTEELTDDELMHVAAAGLPHTRKPDDKE